jgi:hypothetical protein
MSKKWGRRRAQKANRRAQFEVAGSNDRLRRCALRRCRSARLPSRQAGPIWISGFQVGNQSPGRWWRVPKPYKPIVIVTRDWTKWVSGVVREEQKRMFLSLL